MRSFLRALLFGGACTSFGFGLALLTLPAKRQLSSPPHSAVIRSGAAPLLEPTLPAPASAPAPLSPPPRASSAVPPPAAGSARAEPPAGPVAPRLAPLRAPTGAGEAERATVREPPRSRGLLSGFRLLGPGESGGMRLARVAPGSLPAALGLKSYDEIISINGYRLSDPEQALLAYARLRTAERLDLKLARGGAPTEIVYFIR